MGILSEKGAGAGAREMEERKISTLFVVSFHQLTSRLGEGRYRQPCLRVELISDNNAITEASPPSPGLLVFHFLVRIKCVSVHIINVS